MILNNVELTFDIYDLEVAEKIEAMQNGEYDVEIPSDAPLTEIIKLRCNTVFDFFDDIFGEGTSNEIFGNKTNLRVCQEVLADFLDQAKDDISKVNDDINSRFNKYIPNRAQRRTQGRVRK